MECWMLHCFSVYCNKWPQQLTLVKTAKKCRGGKGWITWKMWWLPNYLKEQNLPQNSSRTGINHLGAVTKYLGGGKGFQKIGKPSNSWVVISDRFVNMELCWGDWFPSVVRGAGIAASQPLGTSVQIPHFPPHLPQVLNKTCLMRVSQYHWIWKLWPFLLFLVGYTRILHYVNFLEVCYINSHCQLMFSLTSKALTVCVCFKLILIAVSYITSKF